MTPRTILKIAIAFHIAGLAAVAYYLFSANIAFATGGFILIALSDGILVLEHSEIKPPAPSVR